MCGKLKLGCDSVFKKTEWSKNLTSVQSSDGFPIETACNPPFK